MASPIEESGDLRARGRSGACGRCSKAQRGFLKST